MRHYIRSVCQLVRSLNTERCTVAEIGVFRGEASQILLRFPELHLYMVDVWEPLEPTPDQRVSDIGGQQVLSADTVKDNFLATIAATEFAETRRSIVKATSEVAAQLVPDNLDLVFIDANHSYEYVKQDIGLWWPKVRPGGILCGHDFHYKFRGVQRAVYEMATAWNLEIKLLRGTIWWWAKPTQ